MKTKMTKASKGVIVKANGNLSVQKTPGSKGVKVGANPKATVVPKAKYGMSMTKMKMKK
jgi:hypothetical protein